MLKKNLYVLMRPAMWRLAAQYMVILNYELTKRRWPRLNLGRTIGAICSAYLYEHRERIQQEFWAIVQEQLENRLTNFFSPDELTKIAGADPADLPDLLVIGNDRITRTRSKKAKRSIPRSLGGPSTLVRRFTIESRKVRRANGPADPAADKWSEETG